MKKHVLLATAWLLAGVSAAIAQPAPAQPQP